MNRRFLLWAVPCVLFSCIAGAILGTGCGHAPHEAGVLHLAQEADATTLDPARAYDTNCLPYVRLIYRGLIDYDHQANIINEVAQSHSISPDGKTYSFVLRPNVRFHDGSPVTAEDFRFAIERVLDPETASDGQTFYEGIVGAKEWIADCQKPEKDRKLKHCSGIEVIGDNKIVFHVLKNDVTFLNNLTLPFAYAIPEKYVRDIESKGDKQYALSEHPNGCGPYKFGDWVHDGWLRLDKNPNYYRPGLPKANQIEVKFGLASPLQIMLFEQGSIDLLTISDAFPSDFLRLTKSSQWKNTISHAPMMDLRYLSMNNEVAPFTDVRVRQAFNYAINRDRIVSFLTGRATKARGSLPPGMPAYNPSLFQYPYDPKKARELLKEANFKAGAPIALLYSTSEPWYSKAAQSIQEDMKAVGVPIVLKQMRYGDLKAKAGMRGENGAQLAIMGWIQDYPDPANFLDVLYNGKSITPTSSLNRSFYSNPKVNALLDTALGETDRTKRLKMYQEAEKLIVADAPMDFLLHTERYIARQPWVTGFRMHPMWSATYEEVGTN